MNQVTPRHLKRLEMDDYDLGHLDSRPGDHPGAPAPTRRTEEPAA